MVGSGANVYGGVDWVAMGISAPEDLDLRNPQVRKRPRRQTPVTTCRHTWQLRVAP